jgi:hypothetical protein
MNMKDNKVVVCISPDAEERASMVAAVALGRGFARTQNDARKLVRPFTHDFDLNTTYFILATTHNFKFSDLPFHTLVQQAACGMCVVIGAKSVPVEFAFCCTIYRPTDFKRR